MKPGWLAAAACLTGLAAAACAQAPAQSEASAPDAKLSPLLGQVLDRVVPARRNDGEGSTGNEPGLFNRLAQQHKTAVLPGSVRSSVPLVPALGYAMELLDPQSFAVLRPVPVGGSGALLRTGDVFVLQFSTSLPGRVRLENVDSQGRVADLGSYTVFVDQLNRLPRDKGIQLQGEPGLERLRFYFYPCLPAEATNKAWAADFKGRLPLCSGAPALQSASAQAYGTVAPRALVNLTQPDNNLVFAGSNEFQPGEVTLMEALIRHEGRGNAR